MSPESFEWTAQQGYNLLYVAYHVDHPWRSSHRLVSQRLAKIRPQLTDHEVCCVYHAHFLDSDDDGRLENIVHKPMSEYAAAGFEAARKPPDPTAYKGYERREAGQRDFGFNAYFPGRVVMGGPSQVIERIHVLRDIGITQIGLLVDFGSCRRPSHAFASHLRRSHPAAGSGHLALSSALCGVNIRTAWGWQLGLVEMLPPQLRERSCNCGRVRRHPTR